MFETSTTNEHLLSVTDVASSTWYQHGKEKIEDRRKLNKGRPPSTHSKKIDGSLISNGDVIEAIKAIKARPEFHSAGGYQKMRHYLRRYDSIIVNKKKIYRLCREHGLLLPAHEKKFKTKSPISINRVITKPFQLWELDIKYAMIQGENRFFFLMAVIDVYLRYVVGYHLGLHCYGRDLVRVLKHAIISMGITDQSQLVVRSDNGPQMTSNKFYDYAHDNANCVIHELIPPSTPNKNAHIESFNSIMEVEFFQNQYFRKYAEGYLKTVNFINFYHHERVHSSLKYMTPHEALTMHRSGAELNLKEVRL